MSLGPCPVCGESERLRSLESYKNKGRRILPDVQLTLAGCERCGLAYTFPRPTEAQLEQYYGLPSGWEARSDRGERTENEVREKLDRQLAHKRVRRGAEFERLLSDIPRLNVPGTALDFGCGLGGYLDALQLLGWDTCGIEPGPRQRAIAAERHRIIDEPPSEETFDFVVLNHVIEHLRDPLDVLRALAAATKPGGVIFVSVPDMGRLGEHGRLTYVRDERHLCSWTAPGLSSALGLAGFRALARLDWDDLGDQEPWRLKLVAEKTGVVVEPSGTPLDAATEAVESYAAQADRFRREKEERAFAKTGVSKPPAEPVREAAPARRSVIAALRERIRR